MNKSIPPIVLLLLGLTLAIIFRGSILGFLGNIITIIGIIEAVRSIVKFLRNRNK